MEKINLEDRNVFECEMSVGDVRAFFDGQDLPDDVLTTLDNAQGLIYSDERVSESIVVIRIKT
jgi:hypothetical protein